ncbi:MAG: putative lipid II flippase FtsW [Thermodesulfobacteriota bacterium]
MSKFFSYKPAPDIQEGFSGDALGSEWRIDYLWLGVTMTLVIFGVIMVYSASSQLGAKWHRNSFYFAQKQLAFALFGFMLMMAFRFIPYQKLQKWVLWLLAGSLFSLILVLIPGIGTRVGGASRWFRILGVSIQPAEFSKLVLVIFLAWSMTRLQDQMKDLKKGFIFHWMVVGIFIVLILKEPDLGMVIMITLITGIMLFVGGARIKHLILSVLPMLPLAYWLVWRVPYRKMRVLSYLDPWKDPLGAGFHLKHSFLAFGSGGLSGRGLSGSQQKLFYLPEPHTDFIFSIIGEEFGFIGVFVIAALYMILILKCFQLVLRVKDPFGLYLVVGITVMIGFQALINMLVVMGLLPTKGLTLPFMSYGGSSLILNMICIGILMNITAQQQGEKGCVS